MQLIFSSSSIIKRTSIRKHKTVKGAGFAESNLEAKIGLGSEHIFSDFEESGKDLIICAEQ
eukprot:4492720-Ditylum_brightwellii.AAC.2